ncbi:hypothetical protein F2Q68_00012854 [Brassica cretica]|uniref:Uncharacterized protein n=1 Tax=Brassica cretica TaxID=69181 RepID=A0A8S9HKQ9_BRACR|nr:hypothetical protein F2Q68_00012854 [Brassica cretica]
MRDETLAVTVRKFVSELLNLTKEVILNAKCFALLSSVNSFHFNLGKKVESFSSEIFKAAQVVIDSVVCLCKEFSPIVSRDMNEMNTNGDVERARMEEGNTGVITLLQIDKQTLASKVEVGEIILKLITLIKESLRLAAEAWSCSGKETISATEARRVFLPAKFYLINVVKLVALFPSQSSMVFKEITLCILMISAFKVSLSQQTHGKSASEVMTDLLEKTTVDLLSALKTSMPEIESKTLRFAIALIQKLRNSKDEMIRDRYTEILSEILSIISRGEQLYTCQEMDNVTTELQKLFISETDKHHHHHLNKSEPSLALFLSGLVSYEMSETETCPKSRAHVRAVASYGDSYLKTLL